LVPTATSLGSTGQGYTPWPASNLEHVDQLERQVVAALAGAQTPPPAGCSGGPALGQAQSAYGDVRDLVPGPLAARSGPPARLEEVETLIAALEQRAQSLCHYYWPAIVSVAEALVEHDTLTGADVEAIMYQAMGAVADDGSRWQDDGTS